MPFLDFIRNRPEQSQEPSTQQKPETAQEMYIREAGQERASATTMDRMPAEQKERVEAIKSDLQKASKYVGSDTAAPASPDATANPQPMKQNMMNQEKAAPDLSPTSAQAGGRAIDVDGPGAPVSTPSKEQSQTAEKSQQTVERRPPSWER
jgi:hypothetical protein